MVDHTNLWWTAHNTTLYVANVLYDAELRA